MALLVLRGERRNLRRVYGDSANRSDVGEVAQVGKPCLPDFKITSSFNKSLEKSACEVPRGRGRYSNCDHVQSIDLAS